MPTGDDSGALVRGSGSVVDLFICMYGCLPLAFGLFCVQLFCGLPTPVGSL